MGKRLSDLFASARPRAAARAAARADTAALDAGIFASLGTAAFVGVLAVGLKVSEGAPTGLREPPPNPAGAAYGRTLPLTVDAPAIAEPVAYHPPQSAAFAALPPRPLSGDGARASTDALAAHEAEAEPEWTSRVTYAPGQIDIRRPRYGDGETVLAVASRRAPVDQDGGLRRAADALLQDVSTTWQAPDTHDISFFIASGDEAISWSFSEASPNHGALAYQEERVEIGEAAAGIALSLDSAQVALAHVQTQDVSFWGQRQEEDYSGVILTMKF